MTSRVYVDDNLGSDLPDRGTAEHPFQTAAYALFIHESGSTIPGIFVRNKEGTEYVEITASALKKAKKDADGLAKKAKKADEIKRKEEEKKANEQKKLEESKKIIITEDPSLPKPTTVS